MSNKVIDQRSKEWFEQRAKRFTSSEIHKLMGIKGLGKTGETYAYEKACNIVFGITDEEINSSDMARGTELEPLAFKLFKEIMISEFIEVDDAYFVEKSEDTGGSPDGIVGDDSVLEIKCPRSGKFFKLIHQGIEAIDKEYICQMQHQMYVTGRSKAYFFNYIIWKGKELFHIIEIERDDVIINKMVERIKEAVILRDKYVEEIKSNVQFDLDELKKLL